jgi:antitoxin FitA
VNHMATLRIRDVSAETVAVLEARAERASLSMEAYVRSLLDKEAARMTWDEIEAALVPIRANLDVSTDEIITAIREEREARR